MLSGTKANIAIKLFGNDLNKMFAIGNQIKDAISSVEGIADLNVEQQIERPQLKIVPKREDACQIRYFFTGVCRVCISEHGG